jgi:hypothetical protein
LITDYISFVTTEILYSQYRLSKCQVAVGISYFEF